MNDEPLNIRTCYDAIAAKYAEKFQDEMDHKPFDRDCLDRLVEEVGTREPICDLGCGPGQIARYLRSRGAQVLGVDCSARMIAEARRRNPTIPFHVGDMLRLLEADGSWGGIAAFYSVVHIPSDQMVAALTEMRRVLKPCGVLLVTFHVGDETVHVDEWMDIKVNVDFFFYQPEQMEAWLRDAGFELETTLVREPDPDVEVATRRAYIFAKKSR
ncbi:MAG: class I SAM-dependent methyltransferase [Polyangiaceae bacterium]|nr:class I SAM-dependent methyltransferase [Polyangiaceae bacterium]